MAGDWIKMRVNLDTDPAVVRIASGLKQDRFATVGRLHKIWAWANEHLTDGQDVPIDSAFLDQLVSCSGFAEQMRSVGWLTGRDGSLCFPSFERHNGASAKARALDADRKKNVRKSSAKCPDQNRTETGPEKRREEKSIKKEKEELGDKANCSFLQNPEFAEVAEAYRKMRTAIHGKPDEATVEAWYYELTRLPISEAIEILRFSTACEAKKPVMNGDHKLKQSASSGQRNKPKTNEDRIKDIFSKAGL